ncbi:hypothetical protein [Oceanidesulfovibrio indonesiensis]|nr:hypothetical protein [Oceanidesulfovibrio indonesiensis]
MRKSPGRHGRAVLAVVCAAAAAVVWGFVLLGASVAVLLLNPKDTVPYAVRLASPGARVDVERFEVVAAWPLAVEVQGMRVRGEDGAELFSVERSTIETDPAAGWTHGLWIRRMELHGPRAVIHSTPAGDGGATGVGAAWEPDALRGLFFYKEISCVDGSFTIRSGSRTVEVRDLSFRLKPENGPVGAERADPTLRTAALAAEVRGIEDGKIVAEAHIRGDGEIRADRFAMEIHAENSRVDMAMPSFVLAGELGAHADVVLTPETLEISRFVMEFIPSAELQKQMGHEEINQEQVNVSDSIHFAFGGRLFLDTNSYELSTLEAELPGILSVQGNAAGSLDALPSVAVLSAEAPSLGRVLELARRHVPALESVQVGDGGASATLRLDDAQASLKLRTEGAVFEYGANGARVAGRSAAIDASLSPRSAVDAFVREKGSREDLELAGNLVAVVDAAALGWAVERAELYMPLAGTLEEPAVTNATVRLPARSLFKDGKAVQAGATAVLCDAAWTGEALEVSRLEVDAEGVGTILGHGAWSPASEKETSIEFSGTNLRVAELSRIVDSVAAVGVAAWSPSGTLDVAGEVGLNGPDPAYQVQVSGRSMAFASEDGENLGEKVAWSLDASGTMKDAIGFDATLTLSAGQLLLSRFFLDAGANPVRVNASGRFTGESVLGLDLKASMDGVGRTSYNGRLGLGGSGGVSYDGALVVASDALGELYVKGVEEPFASDLPVLADYAVSGSINLDVQVQGRGGDARAAGMLTLSRAGFEFSATGLMAKDVEIRLPVAYGREPLAGSTQGAVRIGSAQSPFGAVDDLILTLVYSDGALRVAEDVSLPVLGGSLHVSDIAVENPYSPEFVVTCRAQLERARFEELDLGGMQVQGHIAGDLGELRLTRERLDIPGALGGSFFGGALAVHDMAVVDPLAGNRRILATIGIEKLDLEPLSEATGIGRITGRLDLVVEDLVVAYGQPAAFTLTAISRKVSGVDQNISLKAVNSITVLGTGSSIGDAGVGVFGSFFKEFSYGEIGVQLSLHNDVFRVRGLIEEGGVEYLIKKPPLFGINVINRTPGKRVSFSDMLERLSRITAGGAGPETQTEFGASGMSDETQGD